MFNSSNSFPITWNKTPSLPMAYEVDMSPAYLSNFSPTTLLPLDHHKPIVL